MDWLMAAGVGVAGGATMEAVDVIKSVKWHRTMPWNVQPDTIDPPRRQPDMRPGEEQLPAPGWQGYCVATVLRLFVSGAPTGVLAATYTHSVNPLVAYMVGLGALSVVQQLASLVPLAVKNAGRAALGGMAEEAQQQAAQPYPNGHGQANGVPELTQPRGSTTHVPQPGTGITAPQGPADAGGQV
ncbi:hypothetical protein [Streptomyces fuscichromogenes]|uniref:Uncharacterized protein n=1 Tax=Streptomyces fuscichromogenes TaxID=1324013 RepID=A0A917XDG0_9ACTN|nr:hypothetical protein [Streptomyces fuscichromogenes]GGN12228.1 hypothetical protein GCM10011578_038920 [Streptomyces fuscichromogenes]